MSVEETTCNLEPPNCKDWIMKNQEDKMEQVAEDESEEEEPEPPLIALRRKVSFADAFGLDLVSVKEYDNRDSSEGGEYYISCLFTIADLILDMEAKLQQQKLELERFELLPGSTTIRGIVRVLNLCFHKSVYVRVTLDGWQSHFELMAEYVPGSSDGQTDCFCFHLNLMPPFPVEGLRVEFCLRYESAVGTFWASNGGTNYIMFCYQRRRSNFKEHPRENEKEIEKEKVEEGLHKGIRSCLKANSKNYTEATAAEASGGIPEQATAKVGRNRNKTEEEAGITSCKSLKDCCKTLVDRRRKRQAARLAHVQSYFAQKATETQMGCNSITDESSTSIPRLSIQSRTDNQQGFGMDTPPILMYHQIPLLSLDWGSTSTTPPQVNPPNTESQQVEDHQAELSFDAFLKGSDTAIPHSDMQDQACASPESLDHSEVSASRDRVGGLEDREAWKNYSQESAKRRTTNIIQSDATQQGKDPITSLSSDQVVNYQLVKEPMVTTLPWSVLDSRDQIVVPMEDRGAEKDYSQGTDDRGAIETIKSDPTVQVKDLSTSLSSDQVVDYQLAKEPSITTVPCSVLPSRDQIVVPMEDREAEKGYIQGSADRRAIETIKSDPTEQGKNLSTGLSSDQVVEDYQLAKEPSVTAIPCSVLASRDKNMIPIEDRGAKKDNSQWSDDKRAIESIKSDPTDQRKDLSLSLSSYEVVDHQLVKEPSVTIVPCSVLASREQIEVPMEDREAEKKCSQWSADRGAIEIITSDPTEQGKQPSTSLSSDQVVEDYQLVKEPSVTAIPCSFLASRDKNVVPIEDGGAEKGYILGSGDRRAIEIIKSDPTEQGKDLITRLSNDQIMNYHLGEEPSATTVPCSVLASGDQIEVPMVNKGDEKKYSQWSADRRAIETIKSDPTEQGKDRSTILSSDQVVVDCQLVKEPSVTAIPCSFLALRNKNVPIEDSGAENGYIQGSGDRRAIEIIKSDPTEKGKNLSTSLTRDQDVDYRLVKESKATTVPCFALASRDQIEVPVEELEAVKNDSQWSADRMAIEVIKSEPTEQGKDLSTGLSSDRVVDYQLVKEPRVTTVPCSVLGSEPDRLERELEASRDCQTPHHELTSGFLSQDTTKASPGDETGIAHDTETQNSEAGDGISPEECTGSSDTSKVKENTHRAVKDILTFTGIRDVPLTNRQAEGSSPKRKVINIDDSEEQVEMRWFYTELHEEDAESSRKGQDETTMDHSAEIQSVSSCASEAFNENELCTMNKNLHKDNSELQKSEERRFEANEGLKIKEQLNETTIEAAKGGEEDEMCSESKRELIEDSRAIGDNCTDEDLTSKVTYLTDSTDLPKHIPQTTSIKDREVNSQDEEFELGKSLNGSSNRLFSWWQEFNSLGHMAKALLYAILFVIFITTYLCDMPTCLALYLFSLCWWCSQGMKQRLDGASVDVD
ncbi:uncharacterized protein ppp1r3aa isoform X2 [Danio rerio]|uniref:Uncharacterized protein ppp1r3aa isoform X2 n=1 Tax=Danio rerio TaxID=7955 RepID=A0A8M9PXY4_DANRE|nr:uncharacterized protein ppp1r3aa isoform X1 [Danio rerio]|eukprot:XP_021330872.1 uncharacterized protein ppp1r3aa isoform X1 [Danio rerio]